MKLSKEQQTSLKRVWTRNNQGKSYLAFRRTVCAGSVRIIFEAENTIRIDRQEEYRCAMVHWSGMWLGIEPDGHTHS